MKQKTREEIKQWSEQCDAYIEEYGALRESYTRLTKVVKKKLKKILERNDIKYLGIQHRTKTVMSLRHKLGDSENYMFPKHSVTEVPDIAGCRVILHHTFDIRPLIEEICLEQKFKVHGDGIDIEDQRDGDSSTRVTVSLKDQNHINNQGAVLNSLKCEIQIVTALEYSWDENVYPVIYKKSQEIYDITYKWGMSEREVMWSNWLNSVPEKYSEELKKIKSNQYEIDQMAIELYELHNDIFLYSAHTDDLPDEELWGINELETIHDAQNKMSKLSEYVKRFGHRTNGDVNLIPYLNVIIEKAQHIAENIDSDRAHDRNLDFIYFQYISVLQLLVHKGVETECAMRDLFHLVFYGNNEGIKYYALRTLLRIIEYQCSPDNMSYASNAYISSSRVLSYDMSSSDYVAERINSLSDTTLTEHMHLVTEICKKLLATYAVIKATNGRREVQTGRIDISSGPLSEGTDYNATEPVEILNLDFIRQQSIQTLFRLFSCTQSREEKKKIIEILKQSIMSKDGSPLNPKTIYIEQDIKSILQGYLDEKLKNDYEILLLIDDHVDFIKQHYRCDDDLLDVKKFAGKINEIKEYLTHNEGYQIYKMCLQHTVENSSQDLLAKESKEIEKEILQHIKNIGSDNLEKYCEIIHYIAEQYSSDNDSLKAQKYRYFFFMMESIGRHKPKLAKQLINKDINSRLKDFYAQITWGLLFDNDKRRYKYKENKYVNQLAEKWISKGQHLNECVKILQQLRLLDYSSICKIHEQAKVAGDAKVLLKLIQIIREDYKLHDAGKSIVIDVINYLSCQENYSWLFEVGKSDRYRIYSIYQMFSESDWLEILHSLATIPGFEEFYCNNVMTYLSEEFPDIFVRIFKERIDNQLNFDLSSYKVSSSKPVISFNSTFKNSEKIIEEFFLMLDREPIEASNKYAGILVFFLPEFDKNLEKALIEQIKLGKHFAFIIELIKRYDGAKKTHQVCKQLIRKLPDDEDLKKSLISTISGSPMHTFRHLTTDEWESVIESYKDRISLIEQWKTDDNESVRLIADECIKLLNKYIEETELKKRVYV